MKTLIEYITEDKYIKLEHDLLNESLINEGIRKWLSKFVKWIFGSKKKVDTSSEFMLGDVQPEYVSRTINKHFNYNNIVSKKLDSYSAKNTINDTLRLTSTSEHNKTGFWMVKKSINEYPNMLNNLNTNDKYEVISNMYFWQHNSGNEKIKDVVGIILYSADYWKWKDNTDNDDKYNTYTNCLHIFTCQSNIKYNHSKLFDMYFKELKSKYYNRIKGITIHYYDKETKQLYINKGFKTTDIDNILYKQI